MNTTRANNITTFSLREIMRRIKTNKRSRFRDYEENSNVPYILMALFAIMAILAAIYITSKYNAKDKNAFSTGNYEHIAILVDITDDITPIQKESIAVEIENYIDFLTKATKIELYEISQKTDQLINPILTTQTSGRGDDQSELISNKRRLFNKWLRDFKNPILNYFNKVTSKKNTKFSNIMEAIQAIGLKTFAKSNSESKSLIIISDLLQNNTSFSFYKTNQVNFDKFKQSDFFCKISSGKLSDVNVKLMLIRRKNYLKIQNVEFVNFWLNYFSTQNSIVTEVTAIDGA